MSRSLALNLRSAIALAGLACASSLSASIPPSISVKVVSADADAEASSRAVVELLSAYNNFQWTQSNVSRPSALACAGKANEADCLRGQVRAGGVALPAPPALILALPAGEGKVRWTCVGGGKGPARAAQQSIVIDLARIFAGKIKTRRDAQKAALQCIWAAASEVGGNIRID